ncbi:hypothetical protein ABZ498_29515 [Streptomyces lavendulocolor]|uniref:hypothetical protein n=1 Tax=Streptomyces lavendulocolor TaxID=67316 RepID=UPI0033FA70B5
MTDDRRLCAGDEVTRSTYGWTADRTGTTRGARYGAGGGAPGTGAVRPSVSPDRRGGRP